MQLLELTHFNVAAASVGGFTVVFCAVSYLLREGLYISEPIPALLFGFIFRESGWIQPDPVTQNETSMTLSRFVLGIQLMIVGVHLPAKFLHTSWTSLAVLLLGVMTIMWIASSIVMFLCIPNISFLEALIIASCITPTDPVLSNSLVNGKFAERYVAVKLRRIIVAESGANDGFGYPFLFLALYIYKFSSGGAVIKNWVVYTIFYEIFLGVAYGAVVGYLGQEVLTYASNKRIIDKESYILSMFGLAIFIIGTAGMIGTDDLLACFVAGNLFTWNDEFRLKTIDDLVMPTADLALNLLIFIWIGATIPWAQFNELMPSWRFAVLGLGILVFRRLPATVALYKVIPDIKNLKEALFAGFFGPIGVGALFYLEVALRQLAEVDPAENSMLVRAIGPVVYFCILSSVVIHGLAIPALLICFKIRRILRRPSDVPIDFVDEEGDDQNSAII